MLEISTTPDRELFSYAVPNTIPTQGLDRYTVVEENFPDWTQDCGDRGFMRDAQIFPTVAFVILAGSAFDSSMLEIQRQHVAYLLARKQRYRDNISAMEEARCLLRPRGLTRQSLEKGSSNYHTYRLVAAAWGCRLSEERSPEWFFYENIVRTSYEWIFQRAYQDALKYGLSAEDAQDLASVVVQKQLRSTIKKSQDFRGLNDLYLNGDLNTLWINIQRRLLDVGREAKSRILEQALVSLSEPQREQDGEEGPAIEPEDEAAQQRTENILAARANSQVAAFLDRWFGARPELSRFRKPIVIGAKINLDIVSDAIRRPDKVGLCEENQKLRGDSRLVYLVCLYNRNARGENIRPATAREWLKKYRSNLTDMLNALKPLFPKRGARFEVAPLSLE